MLKEKHVFRKQALYAMIYSAMYFIKNILTLFRIKMHISRIVIMAYRNIRKLFHLFKNILRIAVIYVAVWQDALYSIYIFKSKNA